MSPRRDLGGSITKMIPGTLGGWKGAQPGQHVVILPGPSAPSVSPCVPGVEFVQTETFNKADGDLGPVMEWTVTGGVGTTEVDGNQAARHNATAATQQAHSSTEFGGDVTIGITMRGAPALWTGTMVFLVVRRAGGSYFFGFMVGGINGDPFNGTWPDGDPGWFLTVNNSGTDPQGTLLDSDLVTGRPVDGDELVLEIIGDAITGYLNGSVLLSATDATYPGATETPADTAGFALTGSHEGGAEPFVDDPADNFFIHSTTVCPS
jgi:hypothetical protein